MLTSPQPHPSVADLIVYVQSAYTSLHQLEDFGMLDRECVFCTRLFGHFRSAISVSYGDVRDLALAPTLAPGLSVTGICNDQDKEPALFLSAVPEQVRRLASGIRTALVICDQHSGGDVAVAIARELRRDGVRTGLVARGGYHWAWFIAREEGADSPAYARARFLEGEQVHAADVVIGTTQRMLDDMAMLHAAPRERFRLVPNYVLAEHPPPTLEQREEGLILYAGRLHPQKRLDRLLESVALLPPALRERSRVLLLGSGSEEPRLRALIARLGLRAEIRSRIPHRDLLAVMRRCNIYLQCAEYEGHPKTIIEALANGCPTIVTDSPGVTDSVLHGITGLVVPNSVSAISAAVEQLLTSPALAARLGAEASRLTRAALGLDTVFPLYLQACTDAMTTAGEGRTLPPPVVRWDQPMLALPPDAAAANWSASLHAFAKRLDPAPREAFAQALIARVSAMSGGNAAPLRTLRALSKP